MVHTDPGQQPEGEQRKEARAEGVASPAKQAEDIATRLWNRKDDTPENRLTHDEALILLHFGTDGQKLLVEDEMEFGRYTPDADVQYMLDKEDVRHAKGLNADDSEQERMQVN